MNGIMCVADQTQMISGYGWQTMLIYGLLFAGMWFLLIAPQKKKQKAQIKMISELKVGDEVVSAGGIIGKIVQLKPDRVVIKIDSEATIEIFRSFVQTRLNKKEAKTSK